MSKINKYGDEQSFVEELGNNYDSYKVRPQDVGDLAEVIETFNAQYPDRSSRQYLTDGYLVGKRPFVIEVDSLEGRTSADRFVAAISDLVDTIVIDLTQPVEAQVRDYVDRLMQISAGQGGLSLQRPPVDSWDYPTDIASQDLGDLVPALGSDDVELVSLTRVVAVAFRGSWLYGGVVDDHLTIVSLTRVPAQVLISEDTEIDFDEDSVELDDARLRLFDESFVDDVEESYSDRMLYFRQAQLSRYRELSVGCEIGVDANGQISIGSMRAVRSG